MSRIVIKLHMQPIAATDNSGLLRCTQSDLVK